MQKEDTSTPRVCLCFLLEHKTPGDPNRCGTNEGMRRAYVDSKLEKQSIERTAPTQLPHLSTATTFILSLSQNPASSSKTFLLVLSVPKTVQNLCQASSSLNPITTTTE